MIYMFIDLAIILSIIIIITIINIIDGLPNINRSCVIFTMITISYHHPR